jgi:hypothetical protein
MKNLICIKSMVITMILYLSVLEVNAQLGNLNPPDFNAEKAAGIFQYDIEKVTKKLKIIDDSLLVKVSKSLNDYNNKMDSLSLLHAATFQKLEAEFDKNIQIAMSNRDRNQMDSIKAKIQRIIPPIRKQVQEYEEMLNDKMVIYLTESQNKKWLGYQNGKKTK